MKRMMVALAALALSLGANAQQVKSPEAAQAAVESAKAAVENPKKMTQPAVWMKYGQTLVDAYNAPAGKGLIGQTKQELVLIMGKETPVSTESVVLNGEQWTKEVYETRNYYFTAEGVLGMIEITKPVYEDALDRAVQAYAKAAELDDKGKKTKDINEALTSIAAKFTEDAYTAYTLGAFAKASDLFERSAAASATAPLSKLDTNIVYNAGFTAWRAGELDRAKKFFEDCLQYGYYATGGDVYVKLSDIAKRQGDAKLSKDYLEAAFVKFPQSQGILVGLINYYLESGEDTTRLFELIGEAKENEPDNASLYYVEGNIYKQLGNRESAIASYRKCAEIDANYPYGSIGEGLLLYESAAKYAEDAQNEMNDAKYRELLEKAITDFKAAVEPFEKAFAVIDDAQTKLGIAEYIKNICFRFRNEPEYQSKYDEFAAFVEANK